MGWTLWSCSMPDSAVYAEGPARPTGGAAAIAMLVWPDAPIVFESKIRASHMSHAYDFFKPILDSEYPMVSFHRPVMSWHLILAIRVYATNMRNWKASNFQWRMQPTLCSIHHTTSSCRGALVD